MLDLLPSLAMSCFGALFTAIGLWARHLNQQAAAWPNALGEIVESSIDRKIHGSEWTARVRYRFTVQGREYESRQISFKVRSATLAAERKLVAAYPLGRKVRVFYNPKEPSLAVLERNSSYGWLLFVAFGILCFSAAALIPLIPLAPGAA
jgi:hypothetical protein